MSGRSHLARRRRASLLGGLSQAFVVLALLGTSIGPLTPRVLAGDEADAAEVGEEVRVDRTKGRVTAAAPAPITTPFGGGDNATADPTIGSEPLFLPYTPPDDVEELAEQRTRETRTLANPDGSFTLETSNGPLNYQDASGAWQPIDLSLVPQGDDGYRVAATAAAITLATKDGALGAIELDGHRVSLSAPGYDTSALGEGVDQNRVSFDNAVDSSEVWIRPIDIGLEFGASWPDATAVPTVTFLLQAGDLAATIDKDSQTIAFTDAEGAFAGRIDRPIVREGGEDGPPVLTVTTVRLTPGVPGTYVLTYELDPAWFTAAERVFPVILDPTWCIGAGASGCTNNENDDSFDTFVFSADPDSYEVGWTVLRTGFDSRSDDNGSGGNAAFGKMRSILYFPQVSLPDGAVIYDTDLQATVCCNYGGGQGNTIHAYRLTRLLSPNFTWNKFADRYTTTNGVSDTVPTAGNDMHWDVDGIVAQWYTRRAKLWKPPYGFLLRMENEDSSHGETEFRRYNTGTASNRPLLTITYTLPVVGFDFDARLGPTYSPSSMVAGVPTHLPIVIENKTGSAHTLDKCVDGSDTNCWKVGYRWFGAKGNLVAGGTAAETRDLPADVDVGDTSASFALNVTPPSTVGQYTLVLDAVHQYYGTLGWASDYAKPTKYYSRNKKLMRADSTRWTGTSNIERTEFSINVTAGVGAGHEVSVLTGAGDEVGIDLASKNLFFRGDSGLGFADRLPLDLTYGYNEVLAETCSGYQGILAACGWYTNWDERVTGGSNQTGFDYTYLGPDGTPYMLDTDGQGQIVGGAPVLVNRQRVTILDENGGWDGSDGDALPDVTAVNATTEGVVGGAWAGAFVGKSPSSTTTYINGPDKVSLNVYRKARFAIQTSSTTKAGICFEIHNLDDDEEFPDRWFCYTLGGTQDWSAGGDHEFISGNITDAWKYVDQDLYDDVRLDGDFGNAKDNYQIISIRIQSGGCSNCNWTYVDGFRFESAETEILDESSPSWTSGASSTSTDAIVGSNSIKVSPGSGINPRCQTSDGCWSTSAGGMWAYGFADWYWKKAGGTNATVVFYLHNERNDGHCNDADCTLIYYAGSGPKFTGPAGDSALIRVAQTIPTTWTNVRRNVLEDARQSLNLYDDDGSGAGDDVRITGYAVVATDGSHLLIDRFAYGNLADVGTVEPTGPDSSGHLVAGLRYHPNSAGDTTFTWDFSADYPDGSRHYFNRDGLLVRIRDRDRQAITLDWSFDTTKAGPTAYSATAIHAPGDGTSEGGTTYNREFTITRGTDNSLPFVRFDEDLGAIGSSDQSARAVVFLRDGSNDLVKVSPARTVVGGSGFCGATRPNGCVEFTYSAHRLVYVIDPRWDGDTSGTDDYRFEIGRSGTDPMSIKDRSHNGATLLNILHYDDPRVSSPLYVRPIWQDAAGVVSGAAILADLTPDGSLLTRYSPRICSGAPADCSQQGNWPATASQSYYKAVEHQFNGLSRVNTVITYRCPYEDDAVSGCTALGEQATMSRSETFASAKIDNYSDPLAAGRLAWQADPDQVFASLKDSGGTNADWYRTEYVYDGSGQVAETIEVRQIETSTYADTVKVAAPYAYWRLNETSGATMADASGNGRDGSYTVTPTLGGSGVLVRDTANKSPLFNGSSQYAKVTNTQLNGPVNGSFTIDAWIKSASETVTQAWVGSRAPSDYGFDAKLCTASCAGGEGIRVNVGAGNSTWLLTTTVPFDWQKNRWYYVAIVVDDAYDRMILYVDGQEIAGVPFTITSDTPVLTNSTHDLHIGRNGLSNEWFNGRIDEVGLTATALQAADISARFRAGRAVATVDTTVIRDIAGRPLETAASFIANPGFEQTSNGWALAAGAATTTSGPHTGALALSLATVSSTQISQLVPGQTARLQFAHRAESGGSVTVKVSTWATGTSSWAPLATLGAYSDTTWQVKAFDVTLPSTGTDGRILISLWESGGNGYVDDVIFVTNWATVAYSTTAGIGLGLPTDRYGLRACDAAPCGSPTVQTQLMYVTGTNPNHHPAIFPTTTIANRIDGNPGPNPDQDVTSSATYDPWGRQLVSIDPDGIDQETVYAVNQTDVLRTEDGLDNQTSFTYDKVGNVLSTTTPLGRVSSTAYDLLNHVVTSTAPDGVVSRTDYNNYGQATASWANYVNGVVESTDADDTDDLLSKSIYDRFGRVETQKADCGSVADCETNGLAAKATTTYDLLGNTVVSTAYPDADGGGTARPTANFFETYDPPSGTPYDLAGTAVYSRTTSTGTQLAIEPTDANAPACPGAPTEKCNTVTTVDLSGRATRSTDAYGVVSKMLLDLDGRPVQSIANYLVSGSGADENVATSVVYSILGEPLIAEDALGRAQVMSFDALGRVIETSHENSSGGEYLAELTQYLPSGRVSRTYDGSSWTQTEYDGAGRAIRTIANDSAGNAGMTIEPIEAGEAAEVGTNGLWRTTTTVAFVTGAGAVSSTDTDVAGNAYHAMAPATGAGRLRVTTSSGNASSGAWFDLSGPTYQSTHVYKASFDVAASVANLDLTAYLGEDTAGGSSGNLGFKSSTTWQRKTVSWTAPGSSPSSSIHFALKKDQSGAAEVYIDNLVVWDSTSSWADTGIVSSLTAYNADGEVRASAVTPGDPATEPPLVTTAAFDQAGHGVATTVNGASGAYASTVINSANDVAFFPLDERVGSTFDDKNSASDLTKTGTPRLAIAGGIDEARTAVGFANGAYLSRGSNATSSTANISIEAWIRTDATPTQTVVVAGNGTAASGWGIGVDSSGNAAGFHISGSTFTPMTTATPVADGKWHHIVLTRGASAWAMKVDGAATSLSGSTAPGTPGAGFAIGALHGGTRPFTGEVDEVAVYNADITGDIAAHWAAGRRPSSDTVTGLTSRTAFDRLGRTTDSWNAKLVRTRAAYNRLGSQTETILNYVNGTPSGASGTDDAKSTFAYDVLGELLGYCPAVQVQGAGGCTPSNQSEPKAWHYTFNVVGRQTKSVPPVNTAVTALATSETVYETGGRVAKTCTYPAGTSCGSTNSRHVDFTYDKLGRVLTQKTWDRGGGSDTLKFTKTMSWLKDGAPETVAEGSTTFKYLYDTAGRPAEFKNQTTSTTLTAWTYTTNTNLVASRRDGALDVNGLPTNFGYDWARRVTSVDPPDSYVSGVVNKTYRLDGLLATVSFPSSITETLTYDAAKRPTSISLGSEGSLSQAFDRAGNVTSDGRTLTDIATGDAGNNSQSFAYDELNRLTSSTLSSQSRTYTYDLDGNRLSKAEGGTTTTYTYDRTDQLIKQTIGGVDKVTSFDKFGNLTQAADNANAYTTYAYDEANRLTSITPATGSAASFTIDPLDRHATRTVGAASDTYGYVGPTEMVFETGSSGTRSLLDLDGSRLAVKNGSTVQWVIFDLHGSVAALCTAGGTTITDAYRYDGWGQTIATSGSSTNPWKYRGLLGIDPSGGADKLYDMGARDYAPGTGTFTQLDTVQGGAVNPLTMNRFLYALANPATLIDPDGHAAEKTDSGGGVSTGNQDDDIHECHGTSCGGGGDGGGGQTAANNDTWVPPPGYAEEPFDAPEGYEWVPGPMFQPILVKQGWCADSPNTCPEASGDWANSADVLAAWVLSAAEGLKGSRGWASELGRCLAICTDPAARSKAASLLRPAGEATAYGRSAIYKRFAGKLPGIGLGVDFVLNLAEGQDPIEAGSRAAVSGALGAIGMGVGSILCVGVVTCFIGVGGGALVGGWAGDMLMDVVYGDQSSGAAKEP